MSNIIFYSTHCPQCKILEKKMAEKNVKYTEVNDLDEMMKKGIKSVPMLEVDGELLNYVKSFNYISSL